MPQVFPNPLSHGQKMDKVCLIQSNSTFKEVREVMLECMCVLQAMEWDKIRQQQFMLQFSVSIDSIQLLHLLPNVAAI